MSCGTTKGKRIVFSSLLAIWPTLASSDCTRDAMVVFDGSGSMAEMGFNDLDEPRIFEAREAVRQAIPPISKLRKLGLVVYGPSETDECGVSLEFPPIADAAPRIVNTIDTLQPTGSTPIDEAVQLAAETLEHKGDVVLVTDGKETCGGSPCQLASKFAAEKGGLTIHVIGFKVRGDHFSWSDTLAGDTQAETVAKCLADQTAGQYVTAETLEQLVTAFWRTLGCAPVS